MTDEKPAGASKLVWQATGETVRGASHLRSGTPNQDAILQLRESGTTLPLILSVSDGHGSDKCFRSDRGSHYAVEIVAQLMREFLRRSEGDVEESKLEVRAKEFLPDEFIKRWRAAVEADLSVRPFTEEEFKKLEEKDGAGARKIVEANPPLAYGATSLTVLLTDSFILYLQLGDGEILTVSDNAEVKLPLAPDDRLFANETTSLCLETAAQDFRLKVQMLSTETPALVLLTTDGYANSFTDDQNFFKVGSDILEMMRADGFDSVGANVKTWLEEATSVGSGDDCTLGIICRMDALKGQPQSKAKAEPQSNASPPPIAQQTNKLSNETKSGDVSPTANSPAPAKPEISPVGNKS
ncbi:MAG: protein phosphatase 2C domain-containing protein [Pyrinomonadaceae bacterium]|nr:protein phosphatase 2C domain-containing protein [Pyrinomonadaceae bacterium]